MVEAATTETAPLTFLDLGYEVMRQRKRDGVRGLDREWSRWRVHIATADFATRPVTEIGAPEIRRWIRVMSEKDAIVRGEPRKLTSHTINRCASLVSAIFVEAVERELRETNPCVGVHAKKKVDETSAKRKWTYLTLEEEQAIATCEEIPIAMRLAILFALYTGLRAGEQFNLHLVDLHVDGENPHVFVQFGSKGLPPKNGKTREVPLIPQAIDVCRRWLDMLPEYAPSNPGGLVFPSARGTRRHQGKPLGKTNGLKIELARAGITRRVRWHDLRHAAASSLAAGWWGHRWPPEQIRDFLGHASVIQTEKYSHIAGSVLQEAARETVIRAPVVEVIDVIAEPTVTAPPDGIRLLKDAARALARTARKTLWTLVEHVKEARNVA